MDTRVIILMYIEKRIDERREKEREKDLMLFVFLHLVLLLTKFLRTPLIFIYNYPYTISLPPSIFVTLHNFPNTEFFIKHLIKLFTSCSINGDM